MESRLRKSYLEKSLAISNGKKTGKPFIAEMLLRTCVWISSCSWKAPCSLHTSRSVLYVRSLNTLAKFLTNHCRSNSLRNKLFLFFVLVPTFSTNWPGNVCTQSIEVPVRLTIIPDWYLLFASFICSKSPQRGNLESVWSQKILDQKIAW